MYILLIFHDQECKVLNGIWFFENVKQIIKKTNGFIKYNDINKKFRYYKTSKSFFKVLNVDNKNKKKYFLLLR
jgi:hypothetical protein